MIVHYLLILFLILFSGTSAYCQDLDWARLSTGVAREGADGIAFDDSGNVYCAGYFGGTINFDKDHSNYSTTASSAENAYIIKRSATGALVWVKTFGGIGTSSCKDITVDADGSIYVVGSFSGTVDFNPDTGVLSLTSVMVNDVFVCKLNFKGVLVWVKGFGGKNPDNGNAIEFNSKRELIVSGTFNDSVNFNPMGQPLWLQSVGLTDVFIAKFDTGGSIVWVRNFGGQKDIFTRSMCVTHEDGIIFTGAFKGTVDFDPLSSDSIITAAANNTVYLCAITDSGTFDFAFALFGTQYAVSAGIAVETDSLGIIYLAGRIDGWFDFDPGSGIDSTTPPGGGDSFVAKYDKSGQLISYAIIGGPGADVIYNLKLDKYRNIYSVGELRGTCDFDLGPDSNFLTGAGMGAAWICKWNSDYQFKWAAMLNTASYSTILTLELDDSTKIYFNSSIVNQTDFDPNQGTYILSGYSNGDFVTSKWDQCYEHYSFLSTSHCGVFNWNGLMLDSTGTYTDTLVNSAGCDSIVTLDFTFFPNSSTTTIAACDSFNWNSRTIYSSGTYYDTLTNIANCDSIAEIILTLSNSYVQQINYQGCDSFLFRGSYYRQDVLIIDSLQSSNNCDSLIINSIQINSGSYDTIYYEACDSILFRGSYYNHDLVVIDSLQSLNNCDSLIIHSIRINSSYRDTLYFQACDSFIWNGLKVSQSVVLLDSHVRASGCDSLIFIDVEIFGTSIDTLFEQACHFYSWKGTQLNQSGIYIDSLKNANSCDSLVILSLNIENIDDSVAVNANTLNAIQTGVSYQWLDCGQGYQALTNQNAQSFTAFQNGNYAVQLTGNYCIDTSDCISVMGIFIKIPNKVDEITIYPNPGTGPVQIASSTFPLELVIRTLEGKLLHTQTLHSDDNAIITYETAAGLFLFTVKTPNGEIYSFKVIRY